jgi:hypothetical protein
MSNEPVNHLDVTEVAYSIVGLLKTIGDNGESVGTTEPSCTLSMNINGTRFRITVTEIMH